MFKRQCKFTITKEIISQGGQAIIHEGITSKGTPIAVKVFPHKNSNNEAFQRELNILKRLHGKNKICQPLGAVTEANYSAVAYEKYDSDLYQYLFEENRVLSKMDILKLFKRVCCAVAQMHDEKIAHLDIKPENILLRRKSMAVVLCDFGMSYVENSGKLPCRGTPEYMAPEVSKKNNYCPFSADIYSLGVLLHVMVASYFPSFDSQTQTLVVPHEFMLDENIHFLLLAMLNPAPEKRPTIHHILASKLFKDSRKRSVNRVFKYLLTNKNKNN